MCVNNINHQCETHAFFLISNIGLFGHHNKNIFFKEMAEMEWMFN